MTKIPENSRITKESWTNAVIVAEDERINASYSVISRLLLDKNLPFSFVQTGNMLVFGFRNEYDEVEVFESTLNNSYLAE